MAKLKVGVLISGRGSNMHALIEACRAPRFPATIAVVISNEPSAPGLAKAEAAGLKTVVIDHRQYTSRTDFETAIDATLREYGVGLVCLAGFMRLLTAGFVEVWQDRLINIHPSLLPAFKGLNTHARALEAGVRVTGCTVHFVRPEMDDGPIIVQAAVPVLPGDDPDALAARVLGMEHRCYPLALRLIAEGRARVVGNRVAVDGGKPTADGLINPSDKR
ncbi:MAG: phosphoribosylglycinamide formyltransferase [Alphaproteobacteria bacterium]|nr:phosphoribosylglycinamide formyltransferase [Alphaproteobacteria bacterium]